MLRPLYNRNNERDNYRNNERDNYRNKRSSHNDDHHNRDRRDDGIINYFLDIFEIIFMFLGRSGHGTDYHHKRENSGM
jgi:hypothetical protein